MKVKFISFIKGFGKAVILCYLFYKSVLISIVAGVIFGIVNIFLERKKEFMKKKQKITLEFKDGLQGISSALTAGYSMENCFFEARKDLIVLYGENSLLASEFEWIESRLELNISIEEILEEFAAKWNVEDISHFVEVFKTARKTGGDLVSITHSTADKISQKIEVTREIKTLLSGKEMEAKIMEIIPLGIIMYFWICSPGFLDCFYSASGRIVSTFLFAMYIFAIWWSKKICTIRV